MRTTLMIAATALFPATLFAAGSQDTAPTPSETTTVCAEGLVWDLATQSCLTPAQSTNDDSARLDDVRELAHAGLYQVALTVLDTIEVQDDSMVQTYYGFTHRKAGNVALGMAYYDTALTLDPSNIRARSYVGQAHVEAGFMTLAADQLDEIRLLGGRGTWSEASLAEALRTGVTATY